MSIERCITCGKAIDTDHDDSAYYVIVEDSEKDISTLVARCEDHRYFSTERDALHSIVKDDMLMFGEIVSI